MESKFSDMNKKMQDDNNRPLPPELDWENMKEGIFDKLRSMDGESSLKRRNPFVNRRNLVSLMLLLALSIAVFFIYHGANTDQEVESGVKNNMARQDLKSEISLEEGGVPSTERSEILQLKTEESTENTFQNENRSASTKFKLSGNADNTEIKEKALDRSGDDRYVNDSKLPSGEMKADGINSSTETEQASRKILPLADKNEHAKPSYHIGITQPLSSFYSGLTYERIEILEIEIERRSSILNGPDKKQGRTADQLVLEGGVTFWNEGYGEGTPERAQYETILPSLQFQGFYRRSLKRDFFAMIGLQFQQLESRFNYSTTIEDYMITLENTIIQVQNNLITGEQTVIRGDLDLSVEAERRIVHYNRTRALKVPLAFGKTWRFKSFQTDVYVGGAIGVLSNNRGRTLLEGAVIDYDGSSTPFIENQWTVDGLMGARLHYLLLEDLAIMTGIQAQKSLTDWSREKDITMRPVSFSWQVGLSYSLK